MKNRNENYISMLEELYYGRIRPFAKQVDRDSAYFASMDRAVEYEQGLLDFLSAQEKGEEGRQWLLRMNEARSEAHIFSEVDHFIDGFQLGARFMLDTFVLPQQSVMRETT